MISLFILIFSPWGSIWAASGLGNIPEGDYDQLFPRYVKACAVTQIKKIGKPAAGSAGHAVMYVKGMCRDQDAPLPKVKECDPWVNLADPNSGTLISVNKVFKNVNWVAIEGQDLAFHGNLAGAVVDSKAKKGAIAAAVQSGAFHGVQIHEKWQKRTPSGMKPEEAIAHISLGADYALDFGRDSYCSVVPISQIQLRDMVDYLNSLNAKYLKSEYHWRGLNDSCAHVVRNALAAAGIRSYKPMGRPMPIGLFDVVVPANLFLSTAIKVRKGKFLSVVDLYRNGRMQSIFKGLNGMPISHGGVIEKIEMRAEKNQVFEKRDTLFTLDLPLFFPRTKKRKHIFSEPAYTDLRVSLENYLKNYMKLKKGLMPLETLRRKQKDLATREFEAFYILYNNWLESSIWDVNQKLVALNQNGRYSSVFWPALSRNRLLFGRFGALLE